MFKCLLVIVSDNSSKGKALLTLFEYCICKTELMSKLNNSGNYLVPLRSCWVSATCCPGGGWAATESSGKVMVTSSQCAGYSGGCTRQPQPGHGGYEDALELRHGDTSSTSNSRHDALQHTSTSTPSLARSPYTFITNICTHLSTCAAVFDGVNDPFPV